MRVIAAFIFWTVWTVLCAIVGTYLALKIIQSEQPPVGPPSEPYHVTAFPFSSSDQFRGGPVI